MRGWFERWSGGWSGAMFAITAAVAACLVIPVVPVSAQAPAPARGRPGVLLDVPGRPLAIQYEPDKPATRPAIRKVVASMARAASRDFVRGYQPGVSVSGDTRSLWAARVEAWLTDAEVRAVNRLLQRLVRQMQPRGRHADTLSRPHSLTFVLAPTSASSSRDATASGNSGSRRGKARNGRK